MLLIAAGVTGGALLALWAWRPPVLYEVTFLNTPSGERIIPHSINDRGQVVGVTRAGLGDRHLVFWDRAGGIQDLGPVPRSECALNNMGQIAATVIDSNGFHQAFLRDPNGAVQLLGTLGGVNSVATALNNRGQVVGWSDTRMEIHAFIWDPASGMRDLGALGGTQSVATVVNDVGQVFGFCQSEPGRSLPREPCYWNPADETATSGIRLADRSYADMNSQGYIVGKHCFLDSTPHIVLWQDHTGMKRLFPYDPGGDAFGNARFINDMNQVICAEVRLSRRGRYSRRPVRIRHFLWDPQRGRIWLDRYLPRGSGSFEVRDLNNQGCILGVIHARDGGSEAVLLEPIPGRWGR